MRTFWACLAGAIFALLSPAQAQEFKMDSTDSPLLGTTGQVLGKDAAPANPLNWPATFTFKNSEGGACTATAIGQKVILTAAHCVTNGQSGTASTSSTSAKVTCFHHPDYPDDISADFALCSLEDGKALPKFIGGYERINTDAAVVPIFSKVILLGYGCLQPGGIDRNFGSLYQGPAEIRRLPKNDNFILVAGDAAVCFGDSGGGAFSAASADRKLIAVNARGDISRNSWLASTHRALFVDWARKWSSDKKIHICGIDAAAQDCRG